MTFDEMFAAALRTAPESCRTVQIEDGDGLHVMFYEHAEDGQHSDGGTLFVPRALLED
ncbi:hypothetical protein ACLQ2N_16185 [Streptomyces sp. DT224]|uniref:hypothetical protein n=1 Tax=Streptomyces sp. DT224 TaxID=3393426 RepID=UPI003CE6F7B9